MKTHEQLDAEFEAVVKRRAERLGVDPETVRQSQRGEARSILAWQEAAENRGLSVPEFLEMEIQSNTGSAYPTPLCLTPSEVSAYRHPGTLPPERIEHVSVCPGCSSLVAMLERVPPLEHPLEDDRDDLHREIRAVVPGRTSGSTYSRK